LKNIKNKKLFIPIIILLAIILINWFVFGRRFFPTLNLRNPLLYFFILILFNIIILGTNDDKKIKNTFKISGVFILLLIIGILASGRLFRSRDFASISNIEDKENPEKRVAEIKKDKIPTIDRETADRIGNRAMGTIPELSGIYQSPSYYTTIIYKDRMTRVAPLEYSGFFSWLRNNKNGIPGYIIVDMITGDYELVKLDKPIKYSSQEYFKRDIMNLLKRKYVNKFWFKPSFEIDDEGNPYWIVAERIKSIGFSGNITGDIFIIDAINGEIKQYSKDEVPDWVDRVYQTNTYLGYVKDKGMLSNGILNSLFAKTGTYKPTSSYPSDDEETIYDVGFSYIGLKDEEGKNRIYTYTGITSGADRDKSNIGFVLMNNRTGEVEKYNNPMVEEYSAMSSAQGSVQEKGYKATFPTLLVNNNNFIYFMNLKDQAGLTKGYAIVDADDYQKVFIGSSVNDVFNKYETNNGTVDLSENTETNKETKTTKTKTITVDEIHTQIKDSNTEYIIISDDKIFVLSAKNDNEYNGFRIKENDSLNIEYEENEYYNNIINIK